MPTMDEARALIKQGQLGAARTCLTALVRDEPGNQAARNALFESLCFLGEFDRARKHLESLLVLGVSKNPILDDKNAPQVGDLYHNAITAECARNDFFTQGRVPEFLRNPPENVRKRLEASLEIRSGDITRAAACLQAAAELETPLAPTMSGRSWPGFRDGDDLLGPILEFHAASGEYYWIELERVRAIHPGPLRYWINTLWRPATLITEEGMLHGMIPALYHGSARSNNEQIQLGRVTEWVGDPETLYRGMGQRLFLAGEDSVPVLSWEPLEFREGSPLTPSSETDDMTTDGGGSDASGT